MAARDTRRAALTLQARGWMGVDYGKVTAKASVAASPQQPLRGASLKTLTSVPSVNDFALPLGSNIESLLPM